MKIEKYFAKKHDINRLIVFYSDNDLLIPFLNLLLKDHHTFQDPKVFISAIKKRDKQQLVVINLYASLTIPEQQKRAMVIEQLIEKTFGVIIKECNSIKKMTKIHKQLNKGV